MKIFDTMKGRAAISRTAEHYGVSNAEVRAEMQKALDAAWETTDPVAKQKQAELFPNGKPTLEQFIVALSDAVKRERSQGL